MKDLRNKELTLIVTGKMTAELEDKLAEVLQMFLDRDKDKYNFIGAESDDKEYSILSLESHKIDKLQSLMQNFEIPYTLKNVTQQVLIGDFDEDIKLVYEDSEYNKIFIHDFQKDNLTIDDILDKINKFGSQSLTDLDKQILSQNF